MQKHRRVRIMPNAIDTEKYSYSEKKRREVRQELKIPQSATVFGHIGRFCRQKNQGFLVDIFREILKQRKNSVLIMTGTGEDMELIKARVIAAGISDRVVFTGQRSDADRLYSAFDCFLLPSNYEGLPVVGVEAQCSGLHCLFSNKVTPEARITGTAQLLAAWEAGGLGVRRHLLRWSQKQERSRRGRGGGLRYKRRSGAARWILSEKIKIVNRNYLTSLHSCVIIIKALL